MLWWNWDGNENTVMNVRGNGIKNVTPHISTYNTEIRYAAFNSKT